MKGRKSFRETLLASKRSNDMYADLAGKPRLDYGDMIRAPKVRAPRDNTLPRDPSEHELQCAVFDWWLHAHNSYGLPRFALAAIPNAQILMGSANNPAKVIAYLHREGFRDGAPDIMLTVARLGFHGMFIEMKSRKGVIRPEQHEWRDYLSHARYCAHVHRTSEEAINAIKWYLAP